MIAVYIYFYPVTGKLVSPAHALNDGIRRCILAFVSDIKKFIVVENLKIAWIRRRLSLVRLPLYKITSPFHKIPGLFIGYAIQRNRTLQSVGKIFFTDNSRIGG